MVFRLFVCLMKSARDSNYRGKYQELVNISFFIYDVAALHSVFPKITANVLYAQLPFTCREKSKNIMIFVSLS